MSVDELRGQRAREELLVSSHEGGHLALAACCGLDAVEASIWFHDYAPADSPTYAGVRMTYEPRHTSGSGLVRIADGYVADEIVDASVLIGLAGSEAEAYAMHRNDGTPLRQCRDEVYASVGSSHDMRNVQGLIGRASFDLDTGKKTVARLVLTFWPTIADLAADLRAARRLNGGAIRRGTRQITRQVRSGG